jgi:predicted adenine nucleotide alpha hydrolase (AANH) superfamily ATPase
MVLLHACCAPCSSAVIENMLTDSIIPVIYYYNPNIFPLEEYQRRRDECQRYAQLFNLDFIEGQYNHDSWLASISNLENEPERGLRCRKCIALRLLLTAKRASEMGISEIASSLGSSRWKDCNQIAEGGRQAAQMFSVTFFDKNWRTEELSRRRRILLMENQFYNQNYCGCEFSTRPLSKG